MREKILAILADHTTVPAADITPETKLADLHMDSLEFTDMRCDIEGMTDADPSPAQMSALVTVGDLFSLFGV